MPTAVIGRRAFGATFAAWTSCSQDPAAAKPTSYQFETDVWTGSVLLDQGGRSFVLGDLRQPITLLKLWAGWCPACAAEMPQLTAMASAIGRSVEVILVSHPQYWAADQVAARRRAVPFRLATFAPTNASTLMELALLNQGGLYSVPRSLAFRERDRSIVLTRENATDWASAAMLNQVKGLMG